jgi:plastocyanin
MMTRFASMIFLAGVLVAGCSRSTDSSSQTAASAEAAPAAAATTPSSPGTVSGTLPPASGGFPSIIVLEAQGSVAEPPPPAVAPYMDQVQQTFIPPVLMVRTGKPVEFRNNDDVLHNVRVREDATRSPAFNVAIPTGEKYVYTFPRDGFYDVGCDIHPGMAAQVVSTSSPFTAVADAQGNFAIGNVPPGAYKAVVYAGAEKIERDLTVTGDGATLSVAAGS